MQDLINDLKELTNYDGRFRRSQYWAYHIAINLVSAMFIHLSNYIANDLIGELMKLFILFLSIYFIICIQIKRSHDLDKSGHFVWLTLIPVVHLYPLFLFAFVRGSVGENTYGTDPYM